MQIPQGLPASTDYLLRFRLRQQGTSTFTPPVTFSIDNVTVTELTDNLVAGVQPDVVEYHDYDPFGMLINQRTHDEGANGNGYRYGFQGQERDDGIKGEGNSLNYTFRMHDPRVGRFFAVDPLTKKYPELTPYQFSSNNPIGMLEIEGLEGVQYVEITKKDGKTMSKRVVELEVFVAVSNKANSTHYKTSDLSEIKSNLDKEYNNGFKDKNGLAVEFRFSVSSFDVDKTSSEDFRQGLRQGKSHYDKGVDGKLYPKAAVLEKVSLPDKTQGETFGNKSSVSNKAYDPHHTIAHELGHVFLNYNQSNNPGTVAEHNKAGGIFTYRTVDQEGNTVKPTESVNQANVDMILKALPVVKSKTIQ